MNGLNLKGRPNVCLYSKGHLDDTLSCSCKRCASTFTVSNYRNPDLVPNHCPFCGTEWKIVNEMKNRWVKKGIVVRDGHVTDYYYAISHRHMFTIPEDRYDCDSQLAHESWSISHVHGDYNQYFFKREFFRLVRSIMNVKRRYTTISGSEHDTIEYAPVVIKKRRFSDSYVIQRHAPSTPQPLF